MFEFVCGVDESTLFTEYVLKEEIVRCRDCTKFFVNDNQVAMCSYPCGDSLHSPAYTDFDGFCSWANRRYDVED